MGLDENIWQLYGQVQHKKCTYVPAGGHACKWDEGMCEGAGRSKITEKERG